jgi:hypothetical protein
MVVDLPGAYPHVRRVSARASQHGVTGLHVVRSPAGGHAKAAPQPGWRLALELALSQLPSGSSLVVSDANGRDWCIAPANQAVARSLRKAA